ncbi:MAG: aminotransferase class I/II-fold pyridoxal phosphate-dependent enzyme [Deltaproteobacteria bacterium]|nr:aminotransferase class I/II-fold pyridoxal phosphate-dependent enzyme [Deltaproteobacteria bacterium]MBW2667098.1 aminotransferase class I/II-fold pyridoxal phosphate-dependent enzyme [Deltaproteobacteria bacterium]
MARAAHAYPYYRVITTPQDPVVIHAGRELVMLGSNNYLGLTNHPEVKEAAAIGLALYGTGCAGSRLLNGTLDIHVRLEEQLAEFMHREAVLSFSTGFQVNLGVLSCLLGRHDIAFLDSLDHACIIDGCRLGFGRSYKFRHNDMADLDKKLANAPADKGKLIVVDGVFSMEGDVSPLPEIAELKNRYGARFMVDDAHGLGVFGENGRGTPEHFGVEDDVDLVMGTFSKSLAAIGGFIAGPADVVDFIKHEARSEIFSAAPPPASVAAASKAVEIIEREPERRKQLWENTRYMKQEFDSLGFDTGDCSSPVIPLVVGEDMTAFKMTMRLQDEGVFANPVVSPAVPPGRSMIRTSYMATHTREHLDQALEAFAKVGREFDIIS